MGLELMSFRYKPLWKLLIDNDMSKTQLKEVLGLSPSTLAKLSKDENVSMEVLDRICKHFNCKLEDIVEYVPSKE